MRRAVVTLVALGVGYVAGVVDEARVSAPSAAVDERSTVVIVRDRESGQPKRHLEETATLATDGH